MKVFMVASSSSGPSEPSSSATTTRKWSHGEESEPSSSLPGCSHWNEETKKKRKLEEEKKSGEQKKKPGKQEKPVINKKGKKDNKEKENKEKDDGSRPVPVIQRTYQPRPLGIPTSYTENDRLYDNFKSRTLIVDANLSQSARYWLGMRILEGEDFSVRELGRMLDISYSMFSREKPMSEMESDYDFFSPGGYQYPSSKSVLLQSYGVPEDEIILNEVILPLKEKKKKKSGPKNNKKKGRGNKKDKDNKK